MTEIPEEVTSSTNLGLQFPDGSLIWGDANNDVQLVDTVTQVFNLEKPSAQLIALITSRGEKAKMPKNVYLGMHKILSREVVTTISSPVETYTLDQVTV